MDTIKLLRQKSPDGIRISSRSILCSHSEAQEEYPHLHPHFEIHQTSTMLADLCYDGGNDHDTLS